MSRKLNIGQEYFLFPTSGGNVDTQIKIVNDSSSSFPIIGFNDSYKRGSIEDGSYNIDTSSVNWVHKDENLVFSAYLLTDESGVTTLYYRTSDIKQDIPSNGSIVKIFSHGMRVSASRLLEDYKESLQAWKDTANERIEEVIETGREFLPKVADFEETEEIHINMNENDSLQERYIEVVGTISDIDREINEEYTLESQKELAEGFLKAKEALAAKASEKPGTIVGFFDKLAGGNKIYQKVRKDVSEAATKNDSVQDNINYLFGVMSKQYDKMVVMCEKLQESKRLAEAQVIALDQLMRESNEQISVYPTQADIPMRELMTNTQIKASIETYRTKIANLHGTIIATQTSIMVLGRDLPSLRTNMTGDSAVNALLTSAGDFQAMYAEIAKLGSDLTKATEENIYKVTESLIDLQIEDTHTMTYLADSAERSKEMAKMVKNKTEKLVEKVHRDSQFMTAIISGEDIKIARQKHKLLK